MKFCKFNDNTVVTEFIKELLATTYVPMCKVWKKGDTITKGQVYITPNYILKAKSSNSAQHETTPSSEFTDDFDILDTYIFGKRYKGITSNYVSNNFLYDSKLHYQLGKYLYFIRDLKGINLFPYYNMWCNEVDETQHLAKDDKTDTIIIERNSLSENYKLLYVPVRLGETYTIYLNSAIPVNYIVTYIDNKVQLKQSNLCEGNLSICRFNQPQTITIPSITNANVSEVDNLQNYEEYLTLVLQVPVAFNGNLIVLNGDYTNASKFYQRAPLVIGETTAQITTIPSLSLLADTNRYAFSYRLIEYLLHNVICKADNISQNIEWVQQKTSTSKYLLNNNKKVSYESTYLKGIWDDNLAGFISTIIANKQNNYLVYDQDGNVNVEVEKILKEGE